MNSDQQKTIMDAVKNHKVIEAVFVEGPIVYLVVEDHSDTAYEAASAIDKRLSPTLGDDADIRIRAHQGKGVESLGLDRWAKRVL